jgi:hypothetical protein
VSADCFIDTEKESRVHMATTTAGAIAIYDASGDDSDLPLDLDLRIDEVEYARIMRRIGIDGDETDTSVSAFNSSI